LNRFTVEIGSKAIEDLDEIAAYIAVDSPRNAARCVSRIREAIDSLSVFPMRHPVAPEDEIDGLEVRHAVIGNYRVLFTVERRTVWGHGVRHGNRRPLGG
jgi:plasmid stabilization system protein ParE